MSNAVICYHCDEKMPLKLGTVHHHIKNQDTIKINNIPHFRCPKCNTVEYDIRDVVVTDLLKFSLEHNLHEIDYFDYHITKDTMDLVNTHLLIGSKFRHYKGNVYTITGEAVHTETEETLILYKDEKANHWARPKEMFFGKLEVDGKKVQRFTFIER